MMYQASILGPCWWGLSLSLLKYWNKNTIIGAKTLLQQLSYKFWCNYSCVLVCVVKKKW